MFGSTGFDSSFGARPAGTGLFGSSSTQNASVAIGATGLFGQQQSTFGSPTAASSEPTSFGIVHKDKIEPGQTHGKVKCFLNQLTDRVTPLFRYRCNDYLNPNGRPNAGAMLTNNLGGLFGQQAPAAAGQPAASGGLFGQPAQPMQTGGGLFGTNTGLGATNTGGSLFGAASAPAATNTGLFGNTSPTQGGLFGAQTQPAQQNSLFGNANVNTGVAGGGLFGTSNTTGNTLGGTTGNSLFGNTQTSGTGLFGTQPSTMNTGTSFFGTATNTSPQQTNTGLFGSSQPANTGGGLFGNASTNTFGQPTNTGTSLFGQTPTTNTSTGGLFGQPATTQNTGGLFGQTQSTGLFNQPVTTNTTGTGLFGGTTTGLGGNNQIGAQPGTGLFGAANTANQSAGAGGLFGRTATTNTGGLFGSTNTADQNAKPGLFGSTLGTSGTAGTTGLFGTTTTTNPTSTTNTGGLFGTTNTNTTGNTGTGLFGAAPTQASTGLFGSTNTSGGLFGNTNTQNNTGGGLFGSATNTANPLGGGGGGLFGTSQPTQQGSTNLFGAPTNTGGLTGGLFGTQKPATQASGSVFGLNTQSSTFGGNMTTPVNAPLGSAVKDDPYNLSSIAITNAASMLYGTSGDSLPIRPDPSTTLRSSRKHMGRKPTYLSAILNARNTEISGDAGDEATTPAVRPIENSATGGDLLTSTHSVERMHKAQDNLFTRVHAPRPLIAGTQVGWHESNDAAAPIADLPAAAASAPVAKQVPADPAVLPILSRSDYTCRPSLEALSAYTEQELSRVEDFTITRAGYGTVTWPGFTDVRRLNLDEIVSFGKREIEVYSSSSDKAPPVGEGLNKRAIITLYNCGPAKLIKKTRLTDEEFEQHKAQVSAYTRDVLHATFLSLSPDFSWTFRVEHFSRYAYPEHELGSVRKPGKRRAPRRTSLVLRAPRAMQGVGADYSGGALGDRPK